MDFDINPVHVIAMDIHTSELVDAINNGAISFEEDVTQMCITSNCLTGHLKLLRLCARELTDSHKDYKTVMRFIDRLQEIQKKEIAKGSIQVVE